MNFNRTFATVIALGLLAGCGGGGGSLPNPPQPQPSVGSTPPPEVRTFEISVVNLTAAQPFSPIGLVVHDSGYSAFEIGEGASEGLEVLAEGGDNAMFLADADADPAVISTLSAGGPLPPGGTELMMLELEENIAGAALVSAVTMLVNTNDAITAVRGIDIGSLEIGEQIRLTTIGYDSGTEANSELAGTIPGPADGGEGFNAQRDDLDDLVRGHAGIVSRDDGLDASVLSELHRWDNPIARVTISRLE